MLFPGDEEGDGGLSLGGGGDGMGGLVDAATSFIPDIGDPQPSQMAPAMADSALHGGTGARPGPTFDFSGAQLGWDPAKTMEVTEQKQASVNRRHPNLGP